MTTVLTSPRRWGTAAFEVLNGFDAPGSVDDGGLAYSLTGPTGAPVVLVLGGISAHRDPASSEQGPGWWPFAVRNGGPVDLNRYRVLSVDYLGGRGESARPREAGGRPLCVTTEAQAAAIEGLFELLGLDGPFRVIGASYGGMVAMHLAARRPDLIEGLLLIAAAHRTHSMATALRALQRAVLRLGRDVGESERAVGVARGIGMTTYRTTEEFERRFSDGPEWRDGRPHFPVEDYLDHVADRDAAVWTAEALHCLSESTDSHTFRPEALTVPTVAVGVKDDRLVPIEIVREFAARHAGRCRLIEVESVYGHDAFLKEEEIVSRVLREFLGGAS